MDTVPRVNPSRNGQVTVPRTNQIYRQNTNIIIKPPIDSPNTGKSPNIPNVSHNIKHSRTIGLETPRNITNIEPKKLFGNSRKINKVSYEDKNINNNINMDVEDINMEILLLNTLTITAVKV